MHAIKLTSPKSHTSEQIDFLVNLYRTKHPDRYAEWQEIERHASENDEHSLADIQRHGYEFLMSNTDWDNLSALSSAWLDMRLKVVASVS